jgi:hypothetical protein
MSLTKEVRDFFTNRINVVLDAKIEKLLEQVDDDKVEENSISRFCEKWNAGILSARWQKYTQQTDMLEKEKDKLKKETEELLKTAKHSCGYYACYGDLKNAALRDHKDEVMDALYPDINPQIKKIKAMRDNVQGAVLLSTTEAKLVTTLNTLLHEYGGEIDELLALIPN